MKVQVVRAQVSDEDRERYLRAWGEWSGTLFPMGIRAELLESLDEPGTFIELTWFDAGHEAALADDRLVRLNDDLSVAATAREGKNRLFAVQ